MTSNERRKKIYEILQKDGAVSTANLFQNFDVSGETLRRDLVAMEEQGKLTRVHGGAIIRGEIMPYTPLQVRNTERINEKKEIAKKVVEVIDEGDIISLDAGSTSLYIAEAIRDNFEKLTVVTYSLDVFKILCKKPGFDMILCGGNYIPAYHIFLGDFTKKILDALHVQKSFVFPSAISLESGICEYHSDTHTHQSRMLRFADEAFVVGDSSKFEKKALYKVDDMRNEYIYITDSSLPEGLRKIYKANDKKLIIADKIK